MPGSTEEKEKCLEKLNQMQKFIPFLDFMIEKISEKTNEIPLECQLSKLQTLRSMIAEKSEKYSWEVVVKVEDVIQRLIAKLDVKERYGKLKESLDDADSGNYKTRMATSISIVPSSTSTVPVTTTSVSQATVDTKPQEFSSSTADLIMKTLKTPIEQNKITDRDKDLVSNPLGPNQPVDVSGKPMETDLDKDLDGYDLTDCPSLSETSSNNAAVGSVPEKVSCHDDLLSSSREKLSKSLQNRLFSCKTNVPSSQPPVGDKSEKTGASQTTSAFSRSKINLSEQKTKSDNSESSGSNVADKNVLGLESQNTSLRKRISFTWKMSESPKKPVTPTVQNSEVSLKQRLKEKFSTDICEVYRVPGKSVGGSLRCLKESKTSRKSFSKEEDELFKPDVIVCSPQSKASGQRRDNSSGKLHKSSSLNEKKEHRSSDKTSHKHTSNGDRDKRHDSQTSKTDRNESESGRRKHESSRGDNDQERRESKSTAEGKKPQSKKVEDKSFELDKLNDDELLEFVKENMQSLPHLAKLSPSELRKAVQSSLFDGSGATDTEAVSDVSDGSFRDFEDLGSDDSSAKKSAKKDKSERKEPHPLASVKVTQVGPDGVAKNVKPIVQPNKDTKILEEVGDRTHDLDDDSFGVSKDEDTTLKLIEETPPKTYPRKKKGLLELPMPVTDDLFEDISSIESFEPSSPSERLTKLSASSTDNRNKSNDNKSKNCADSSKAARETWGGRPAPNLPRESNQSSKPPSSSMAMNTPKDKLQPSNQEIPMLGKPLMTHGPQDVSQQPQSSNRYPNEFIDPRLRNSFPGNYPKRYANLPSEPTSYAEYKRMKRKEQERMAQRLARENPKSSLPDGTDPFCRPVVEKDDENTIKKNQDPWYSGFKDSPPKHINSKSHPPARSFEGRKSSPYSKQWRQPNQADVWGRSSIFEESWDDEDERPKKADEKRYSTESEELISPLEELYRDDDKPKTGRGYGIQSFKIPKKVRRPDWTSESNKSQSHTNSVMKSDTRTEASNTQCQVDSTKRIKESVRTEESDKCEISQVHVAESTKDSVEEPRKNSDQPESRDLVDSTVTEEVPSKSVEIFESSVHSTKTDTSINQNDTINSDIISENTKTNENSVSQSATVPVNTSDKAPGHERVEGKTDVNSDKTDVFAETSNLITDAEKQVDTTNTSKATTEKPKCEAQMVECDSSMESSSLKESNSGKDSVAPSDKNTTTQKEEVTKELVEALIRKSFQSGEGKLLLAQVKLFEEIAKKLNSKKLKTIQRIINSESGSSSSFSESSSEDERRKKKSKKSEQKVKKRKKRGRKRKYKLSSSSSWSETEESSEEEYWDKKEVRTSTKKTENSLENSSTPEEIKSKSSGAKTKVSRGRVGRKPKQKQNQTKLLDEILDESSQQDDSTDKNLVDSSAKEPTQKKRGGRQRGRTKTELDRLHDDIRSMFISAGVVTATGQRMCRILKQSGGNMNNLDIVKESAKMVEEEKLKHVRTRSSRSLDNSQSSDKGTKAYEAQLEYEEDDPKLRLTPRVALQRVDLDNFGYGIKISEDCISFRRMTGRNTAIRGAGVLPVMREYERNDWGSPPMNVFLARNKRKFERLRDSKCKKVYKAKKLMDIVRNLPLKMARMKHLQLCEKKSDIETISTKDDPLENLIVEAQDQKVVQAVNLSNSELLCYAFEKRRRIYICKLCSHVTRNITAHYKKDHTEHEVLISRLCLHDAELAKLESKKNNYGLNSVSLGNSVKRKRNPETYRCRMCTYSRKFDIEGFACHLSTHTGEYRYQCPACEERASSRENLKFHILAKHPKGRYEFYYKIIQVYQLTIEGSQLFGYLCSLCHYVQICRSNLEKHVSIQHGSSEDAVIIKINMSSGGLRGPRKKSGTPKNDSKETSPCSKNVGSKDEDDEEKKKENGSGAKIKKNRQRSESSEGCGDGSDIEVTGRKRIHLNKELEVTEVGKKVDRGEKQPEEEINVEDDTSNTESYDVDAEDCADLKSISSLKGSDIICSMETPETSENPVRGNAEGTIRKLKVGPLAAILSPNSSEVLYECYVKGCLFSTRAFDLFEKHIQISHWRTKWDGICDICCPGKDNILQGKNPFKLLTALNHLKLHVRGRAGGGKLSREDLIMELKLLTPSEECVVDDDEDDENVDDAAKEKSEVKEGMSENSNSGERPFPVKPLLRVRNLLGDRLSTPKAEENDVVAINEDDSNNTESSTGSSKMFTIENVRSLTDSPSADSDIKIEQVCSLKDLVSEPASQLASGKTILVRSCPTRKIAIRPKPSALSVDVGTINVVQPPVVGHPVVLSPISSTSPIRIISTALSPNPTFAVKPIVVPADSVRLSAPNLMSVVTPSLSPSVTAPNILPVSTSESSRMNTEVKAVSQKQSSSQESSGGADLATSKIGFDVEVIPSRISRSKSPSAGSTTSCHTSRNSSDTEDTDEKDIISSQRFASSPNTGKKSVKDAKIYREMLTKTKLCHLFKCMGIECSFTCNNENVFTQHIGLHEAQRRLKRNKGMKTIYLRSANKTTRAFYWQQCAYCCEVVSNTNKALGHHILEEHGHCMYQCAFCFYRAVSHCYVEIHQNLAHGQTLKTTPRVIYKCKPLKVPPSQTAALEKHGRKQSVRPYHCDQCGRKFYITQEFTTHLQSEHQSVTAYTCHICKNLCFKIHRLINHYKLHSYSTYQCAYCLHGTETEKEMVFHLCNFHFSQPAIMYIRALAEGQSFDEKHKPIKKKKQLSNELESLKVIVYEGENPNLDCIVEADADEEVQENTSETPLRCDLSAIVAELGIYTETETSSSKVATPLMKELATISGKTAKHLTVKTLLPNAQFSSENENGGENCSVLISSGLSVPSDAENDREMNIPLGQLPLEAVNIQHKETAPASSHPNNIGSPDRNLKLNEIIVNLQHKDKSLGVSTTEEDKVGQTPAKHSSAVHKLPPVVVGRTSASKNAYPSKSAVVRKKSVESQGSENAEGDKAPRKLSGEKEAKAAEEKSETTLANETKSSTEKQTKGDSSSEPLIMNVVSLSKSEFDKGQSEKFTGDSIIISDVCSLSTPSGDSKDSSVSSGVVLNVQSAANVCSVLKPPIIRLEDFTMDEDSKTSINTTSKVEINEGCTIVDKKPESAEGHRSASPDVIILDDEKAKHNVTVVTLDSDDEKEENAKKKTRRNSRDSKEAPKCSTGNETIRKEMELLRNQIANETDSLLLDEPEAEKPTRDLSLNIKPAQQCEDPNTKTLLSPIEEAICSLNRKLESENQVPQNSVVEEKKEKVEETPRKSDGNENKTPERPRTRFGRRMENTESAEKNDGEDSSHKKDVKFKRFKGELIGKDLFICGNDKCNFAADDDTALKDHLYVCDLSRDSSMLVCPHCSRQIKQFRPYLEHLKYHGEKRFHCGLCTYSSAVDIGVSNHLKQKHKCSGVKVLPKESKEGHLVYYPKNYKVEKVDFEVNGYSPGDEDKLPLQSVYQVNVKCAKCPYFTKVRSNMVRHLKIHVKSVETEGGVVVPSTAPTNPVPCLETKERMFDKMTNLAASSQMAQAKEKTAVESLSAEEEAKLPQYVAEQMRYKCCLSDCNYITVDDGMLRHHIKALHDEISYYSCPHCKNTVHVDVRHVTLDKIGFHLKHHDTKLYKCAHCIFFHYQKNVVEKHTVEKHPDRRYFVHVVREPKPEITSEEEPSTSEGGVRVWKCGLCSDLQTPSKGTLMDHLLKTHNTKSKYKCKFCSLKGNNHQVFTGHFASKHPGEKVEYLKVYYSEKGGSKNLESQSGNSSGADSSNEHFDTTPLWQRGAPRIRHIRGILIEEEEIKTKKSKKTSESEAETSVNVNENAFYCPLCTNKKKPFYTRNEHCFRTHLYQELNYQQFACILCGKMFVDKKDFERHHSRVHPDKTQSLKQTKEDHEIKFWVDQVIAKQRKQMEERKRKLTDAEDSGDPAPPKKKKEG